MCILFWFVGDDAVEVEQLPVAELTDGICQVLETLLHKTIPAPIMAIEHPMARQPAILW